MSMSFTRQCHNDKHDRCSGIVHYGLILRGAVSCACECHGWRFDDVMMASMTPSGGSTPPPLEL